MFISNMLLVDTSTVDFMQLQEIHWHIKEQGRLHASNVIHRPLQNPVTTDESLVPTASP